VTFDYTDYLCKKKMNINENNNTKIFFNSRRKLIGFVFIIFDSINLLIDELWLLYSFNTKKKKNGEVYFTKLYYRYIVCTHRPIYLVMKVFMILFATLSTIRYR
jgi:hypothetical protein